MQSVFVIITKLIASKNYFCKEFFCNNFGRDGIVSRVLFLEREITKFWGKLSEFCEKLSEFHLAHK